MRKEYRIRLLLSKRWIQTQADITEVTYIVYAPDREQALNYAYEIAYKDHPLLSVIRTEIDPLYN